MKKYIIFMLVLVLALPSTTIAAVKSITVKTNGVVVAFPDAKPYIDQSSRTLVPVRFISESLGGQVSWDKATKTVTITKGKIIKLTIGSKSVKVDDKTIDLDTKPVITDSRTFVPLRFVSEAFGATVGWDSPTKTVSITTTDNSSIDNKALADMIRLVVNYEVNEEYAKIYDYLNPKDLEDQGLTRNILYSGNTYIAFGFLKSLRSENKDKYEVKCYFEKKSDTEITVTYGLFANKSETGVAYNKRLLHKIDGKWYIDIDTQPITNLVAPKYSACI